MGTTLTPRTGHFIPRNDPLTTVQETGWARRSGQLWKISYWPGFDLRTVQPVASRYTD